MCSSHVATSLAYAMEGNLTGEESGRIIDLIQLEIQQCMQHVYYN